MLHPQARALLELIEQKGVPPTHTLSPQEARTVYRERRFFTQPEPPQVGEVRELSFAGPGGPVPLRLYRPLRSDAAEQLAALVYYHGGGWTIGDLETHDTLCRELANGSGCAVVAVDYRLGPEHRFPAAVDDSIAALRWIHANAQPLGLNASRIAVGGDSAGGNLAAVLALAAREQGIALRYQVLIYPVTSAVPGDLPSHTEFGEGYVLSRNAMERFTGHYFGDDGRAPDWRGAPLLAEDLSGLPPALVMVGTYDVLRDDGVAYANAMTEAGNQVTLVEYSGMSHGFINMAATMTTGRLALCQVASALRHALA